MGSPESFLEIKKIDGGMKNGIISTESILVSEYPKSVSICFGCQKHTFRIFIQQTFGQILEDACKHWRLESEDYELQDEEGCVWPSQACATVELFNDMLEEERKVKSNPVLYLRSLLMVGEDSTQGFNPVPLYPSFGSSVQSQAYTDRISFIPAKIIDTKEASQEPSEAVRKAIDENRVHIPLDTTSLNREISLTELIPRYKLYGVMPNHNGQYVCNKDNNDGYDQVNLSNLYQERLPGNVPLDSNFLTTENLSKGEGFILEGLNESKEVINAVKLGRGSALVKEYTSDSFNNPDKDTYSCDVKSRFTTDNMNGDIVGNISKNSFNQILPHKSLTFKSPHLRSKSNSVDLSTIQKARIRLLRGYEHVTIDEILQDKEIQVGPTAIKIVRLVWEVPPRVVLLIKKVNDSEITEMLREMSNWLKEKGIEVLVEPSTCQEISGLTDYTHFHKAIDLIICLGGDGTVLHANYLFQEAMPPVMAFNLGSLGFLTPFGIRNFRRTINSVLSGCNLTLRSRLYCVLRRFVDGNEVVEKYTALNEVVIERGISPYLCDLECFCDGHLITNIQADGIIISSTTGSSAYSLSAGGSIVHPQVPAILFTPICPHSLSFRPILFPDCVELKIRLCYNARSPSAWVSFDGRSRRELKCGDFIIIKVSKYPFVWIIKNDVIGDWFKSLGECLNWNDRKKQKCFGKYSNRKY